MSNKNERTSLPCQLTPFKRETNLDAWPQSPQANSGHLASSNRDWRTVVPALTTDNCTQCGLCLLFCPEGALIWDATHHPSVQGDWCKGCGICAKECPKDIIEMKPADTSRTP